MKEKFQPKAERLIDDLETLKVLVDPFRLRILEAMGKKPVNVKGVARELRVSPKKLYYHVNLLEKHGIITVVDTQIVSGIVEKYYQTRAHQFVVDKDLLLVSEDENQFASLRIMLSGIFDATVHDIIQAAGQGLIKPDKEDPRHFDHMNLFRRRMRLSYGQQKKFIERLNDILEEFHHNASEETDDLHPYGLTLALYPMNGPPLSLPEGDEQRQANNE